MRQIPTVGSETCGVFVQYRGTAGRRPGTIAAVRRGRPDSTGHTGSAPAVPPAGGDTRQIFACHCEERSDGTIRSPAVAQSKEQRLRRIRESAYGFARSSTGLPGFPAGRTDCHTSAIQATHPSPWLFRRKSQVLSRSTASPSPGRTGAPRFHLALARNDMQKLAACPHCKDALGQKRGTFHPCLEVRKPTRFMDVIARSGAAAPRRGNPSLLRQHITKSNT